MSFECRLEEEENFWESVDASDVEVAAAEYVRERWDGGAWAGDPIPDCIEVIVRDATGQQWMVKVSVDWDPVFFAGTAEERLNGEP